MTKESEPGNGTNQTTFHKVPSWLKSAKHTPRKKKADESWQRMLVEQALSAVLEQHTGRHPNTIVRAVLHEALKQLFKEQPTLYEAIRDAFPWNEDGDGITDYAFGNTLADVVNEAAEAWAYTLAGPKYPDGEPMHLTEAMLRHSANRARGRDDA